MSKDKQNRTHFNNPVEGKDVLSLNGGCKNLVTKSAHSTQGDLDSVIRKYWAEGKDVVCIADILFTGKKTIFKTEWIDNAGMQDSQVESPLYNAFKRYIEKVIHRGK